MRLASPTSCFAIACFAAASALAAPYAYVASGGNGHTITVIDTETKGVVAGPVNVRDYHFGMAVAANGERIYALSRDASPTSAGTLSVISTTTGSIENALTVGISPQDVVASPDGAQIYVVHSGERTILALDARTYAARPVTLPVCGSRLAISSDSTWLYAGCSNTVVRFDTRTLSFVGQGSLLAGDNVAAMVVSPDGLTLYVLALTAGAAARVYAFATATLTTAWSTDLTQYPRAIAVNPDGRSVYVAIATVAPTGALLSINTDSGAIRGTLAIPDGPRSIGVAPDGRTAEVATFLGPVANVDLTTGLYAGALTTTTAHEQVVVATGPLSQATRRTIVEFYHEELDHYFMTGYPNEIGDLDRGVHTGWRRTGETFQAFENGRSRGAGGPVCRFYGKPSAGLDSHFYSGHRGECDAVTRRFSDAWQLEAYRVFDVTLPNLVTGSCPLGTIPVYRLWNGRVDSNHRYTTSRTLWGAMRDQGFVPEGYGNEGVAMCAVAPAP